VDAERILPSLPWGVPEIEAVLPHRAPFLLVDEVTELVPGERAAGSRAVCADEYYFAGHFPGYPIMPGVLIVEALAQLGAIAILTLPEHAGKLVLFGGIERARFRAPVYPGAVLRLEVSITGRRGPVGKGTGRALLADGKLAAEADLTFAVADRPG